MNNINNMNNPNYVPPRPAPPVYAATPPKQTKNKFLTFVFALIPGAGQMYHGLMKRGISLMTLFVGIIAVAVFTYISALIVFLPAIWFYSFFDTINRMHMTVEELACQKDEYLFNEQFDLKNMKAGIKLEGLLSKRRLFLGWAVIGFSVWLIFKIFSNNYFLYSIIPDKVYAVILRVTDLMPSLVIPAICIAVGVKLIRGSGLSGVRYDEYTVPDNTRENSDSPKN